MYYNQKLVQGVDLHIKCLKLINALKSTLLHINCALLCNSTLHVLILDFYFCTLLCILVKCLCVYLITPLKANLKDIHEQEFILIHSFLYVYCFIFFYDFSSQFTLQESVLIQFFQLTKAYMLFDIMRMI